MKTFEVYEKYPSTKKSFADVEKIIDIIKNNIQVEETFFYNIHISIYEIFVNAIYHGNKLDASKFVDFYAYVEDDILTIRITDQGEGFELAEVPCPLAIDNKIRDSGRGIFVTHHYAESLRYEKTHRGFCSILTFHLEKEKTD